MVVMVMVVEGVVVDAGTGLAGSVDHVHVAPTHVGGAGPGRALLLPAAGRTCKKKVKIIIGYDFIFKFKTNSGGLNHVKKCVKLSLV